MHVCVHTCVRAYINLSLSLLSVPVVILSHLPDHTVVQEGVNVTLEVEFSSHPLLGGDVVWKIGGRALPGASSVTLRGVNGTISRLLLADAGAELNGRVEAALVPCCGLSSNASSSTHLVVLGRSTQHHVFPYKLRSFLSLFPCCFILVLFLIII